MKCNGCGAEIEDLCAVFLHGDVGTIQFPDTGSYAGAVGKHRRTFCANCTVVMKDIVLNSDLSDHWHKYEATNE